MNYDFHYVTTWDRTNPAVVVFGTAGARIWKTGVKSYRRNANAEAYLESVAREEVLTGEPDEIVRRPDTEDPADFEDRVFAECFDTIEKLASYTRLFPNDPAQALDTPRTYYADLSVFPPQVVWYTDRKEATRDADGFDVIYDGKVDVYDPAEIERIEAVIASYPKG